MSAPPARASWLASLDEYADFDDIVDVRSPSEYAEDHLPGAISCPVLDDAQRAEIGTLYKQVSPFVAKRLGAAYVSENIARHLRQCFQDRDPKWRPLIYCWRGGKRSGAMTTVLRQIGWDAKQLEGGYKNYRRQVVADLDAVPTRFAFHVIGGATGSAKSRILQAIEAQGGQVLDLEELACHKGSVLGVLPEAPQPAQKGFDSALLARLNALDPRRTVYVEAESRKIGALHLPETLIGAMRAAPVTLIEATLAARVEFLLRDYDYFVADVNTLCQRLDGLRTLRGHDTVNRWVDLARSGQWPVFVSELLTQHYDTLYEASQGKNYVGMTDARRVASDDLSPAAVARLAAQLLG
jgi:tRNA 2-selenouridine synthase